MPKDTTEGAPPDRDPKYRINAVAEMTGVPTATLRAWERRYGVPTPDRSANRYRLYGEGEVAAVRAMARRLAEGMAASEAAAWVRARQARGEALEEAQPPAAPRAPDREAFTRATHALVAAATAFDVPALEAALQVALLMGPAVEVFEGVLAPALVAMGHQWATGISGVGEEHLATQAIFTAARELVRLVQPGPHSPRLLLACVDGETHEVPIYGVALHAARRGWSATLLGARTPPPALEAALHHMAPAAVGLSVTVSVQDVDPEALFARYGAACGRTPWIVGGASAERYREAIEAAGGRVGLAGEDLSEFLSRARPRAR